MKKTAERKNGYEKMTEQVVARIQEKLSLPWDMKWDDGRLNKLMLPINAVSGKEYRMGNRFWLLFQSRFLEDAAQEWVTYLQAEKLGGNVKKGEKGTLVSFFTFWDKKRHCTKDENSEEEDVVPYLRVSTVFDISQCEGIKPRREVKTIDHPPMEQVDSLVEKFADATELKLELTKKSGSGSYSPSEHLVSVAGLCYHKTPNAYYSTVFHELVHSTGKAMGRDMSGIFGNHKYSEEEIVAECGAMLLCMEFGILKESEDNSVEYLRHWGEKLTENPKWLIQGMSKAEKAVQYIFEKMGYTPAVLG